MTTHTVQRTRPPLTGDERTLLAAYLDFHRATAAAACEGLPAGARQLVLPSSHLTPVGVISHLRWLEHFWCEVVLAGRRNRAPYRLDDPQAERQVEPETIAQAVAEYTEQCDVSREVLAALDLDHEVDWHGRSLSVRWVMLHLVGETARHNGHLDTVRELVAGPTGE